MSKVHQALEQLERRRLVETPQASRVMANPVPAATPLPPRPAQPVRPGEFERLASKILHARAAAPFRTIMIASPDHGEGASTVAAGLAVSLAERGALSVLLVDANLRRPALHEFFEAEAAEGLAELAVKDSGVDLAIRETSVPYLHLLTAGGPVDSPAHLFDSPRFRELLDELQTKSDITIFDAPPVLPYADTLTLAARVDRVVLVTQAERTQRGQLERATEELAKSGATILGVVLNRTASHAPLWLQRRFNL